MDPPAGPARLYRNKDPLSGSPEYDRIFYVATEVMLRNSTFHVLPRSANFGADEHAGGGCGKMRKQNLTPPIDSANISRIITLAHLLRLEGGFVLFPDRLGADFYNCVYRMAV